MKRLRSLLLLAAFAAACGDSTPIPDEDLLLRVAVTATEVEFGAMFPLTVVRVWNRGLTPEVWHDDLLAPLTLRLVESTRREDGDRIEETRRYEAWAFSLRDVTIPTRPFRAVPRAGGDERTVVPEPVKIRVRRKLDPNTPGPPELPEGPLHDAFPWTTLAFVAIALAVGLLLLRRRRRTATAVVVEVAVESPAPPSPRESALRRIDELRARAPDGDAELQSYYTDAANILRVYVGERFDVSADELTSQELIATSPGRFRAGISEALAHCDLVRFARHRPTARQREHMLDAAATFVRESSAV
ncbi:MAG: hypothetical protein ACYTGZ_06635 [Planctomycetota bacterium]|jgi:hypothetical protein